MNVHCCFIYSYKFCKPVQGIAHIAISLKYPWPVYKHDDNSIPSINKIVEVCFFLFRKQ